MKATVKWAFVLGFAWMWTCCGGGQNQSTKDKLLSSVDEDVSILEHMTGIDDDSKIEIPAEDAEPIEPEATEKPADPAVDGEPIEGPDGAILPTLVITGEPTEGTCSVETATDRPEVITQDVPAGTQIALKPGKYDVHCKVTSLAGAPVVSLLNVEIPASRRIKKELPVRAGEITLVLGAGKGCRKQSIRIKEDGSSQWIEGEFKTCVPIRLQAGEYEAEMGKGKNTTPITGIQVYDGSKRNLRVQSH